MITRQILAFVILTLLLISLSYFLLDILDKHRGILLVITICLLIVVNVILLGREFYRITDAGHDRD